MTESHTLFGEGAHVFPLLIGVKVNSNALKPAA